MIKKNGFSLTFFLLFFIATELLAVENNPTVQTPSGKIKGHYEKSLNGREFRSFEGIPYAKPPVGLLRFQVIIKLFLKLVGITITSTEFIR